MINKLGRNSTTATYLQTLNNSSGRMSRLSLTTLFLCHVLLISTLTLTAGIEDKAVKTQDTDKRTAFSLSYGDFDSNATDEQSHSLLQAHSYCTNSSVALSALTTEDRDTRLTFSVREDQHVAHLTSSTCRVQFTSQPTFVISAVLLDHSACGGGLFVLLWDNARHRRWDVCSAWNVPGPDYMTSSNIINVSVELVEITGSCDFTINVRAMEKTCKGELELKYLSGTEGMYFFQ